MDSMSSLKQTIEGFLKEELRYLQDLVRYETSKKEKLLSTSNFLDMEAETKAEERITNKLANLEWRWKDFAKAATAYGQDINMVIKRNATYKTCDRASQHNNQTTRTRKSLDDRRPTQTDPIHR